MKSVVDWEVTDRFTTRYEQKCNVTNPSVIYVRGIITPGLNNAWLVQSYTLSVRHRRKYTRMPKFMAAIRALLSYQLPYFVQWE